MKLFYKQGACSLAPHIVLCELNADYEKESVDLAKKVTASGEDFWKINPKGSVPALRMDNGEILTEVAVICHYLADQKPESNLMPKAGTIERYRCMEWLNYIATEMHKGFGNLFFVGRMVSGEQPQNEVRQNTKEALGRKLNFISEKLGKNDYLMGQQFTVADAYLYTVLSWSGFVGVDLSSWANIEAYVKRVAERPAVQRARQEEA